MINGISYQHVLSYNPKRMPSAGRDPGEGILLEIPFDLWGTGRMFACLRYHIVCSKDSTSF